MEKNIPTTIHLTVGWNLESTKTAIKTGQENTSEPLKHGI